MGMSKFGGQRMGGSSRMSGPLTLQSLLDRTRRRQQLRRFQDVPNPEPVPEDFLNKDPNSGIVGNTRYKPVNASQYGTMNTGGGTGPSQQQYIPGATLNATDGYGRVDAGQYNNRAGIPAPGAGLDMGVGVPSASSVDTVIQNTNAAATGDPDSDLDYVGTGFARSIAPNQWDDVLSDPGLLAQLWLEYVNGGETPSGNMVDRFAGDADQAQFLRLLLNPTLNANDTSNDTTADMINWIANLLQESTNAGGRAPVNDAMLKNLVRAGAMSPDEITGGNNALGELLGGGDDNQQISNYVTYATAASTGLNPQAQAAVVARLERWAREWKAQRARDPENTTRFGDFVAAKGGIFGAN